MDKSSGVISSDLDLGADKIMACLDCGTGKSNGYVREDFENARGNFNVVIKKIDSLNTKVLVSSSFHATKKTTDVTNPFLATKKTNDVTNPILPPKLMPYNSTIQSDTVECNSTGVLEKQLLKYLGRQ
ncbi:MAG TPA: hypothetical protein VKS81_05045 [Bacteroidota bacterium]|nr:hypothetical protein [Bacteroidota bacterium]